MNVVKQKADGELIDYIFFLIHNQIPSRYHYILTINLSLQCVKKSFTKDEIRMKFVLPLKIMTYASPLYPNEPHLE